MGVPVEIGGAWGGGGGGGSGGGGVLGGEVGFRFMGTLFWAMTLIPVLIRSFISKYNMSLDVSFVEAPMPGSLT